MNCSSYQSPSLHFIELHIKISVSKLPTACHFLGVSGIRFSLQDIPSPNRFHNFSTTITKPYFKITTMKHANQSVLQRQIIPELF
jgi:hypothetical protein